MPTHTFFAIVDIGATDEHLLDQMKTLKRAREESRYEHIVCLIHGFDSDPRELCTIPEVRPFCSRLIDLGFISYLDVSTLYNLNISEEARGGWGAYEVLLCSKGNLSTIISPLSPEENESLYQEVLESNRRADKALGPIAPDELAFDLTAIDNPNYKEDAVREDIIAPILRKMGYKATGTTRMERSKTLAHPFVLIGSKKHKINVIPDYTLFANDKALLVLDAKSPTEMIVNSVHAEQAFSYAIHPEVRCQYFALCNGRQLAVYHVSESKPVFLIDCKDIRGKWGEVEKYLHPKYLLIPQLRDFKHDYGIVAKQLGLLSDEEVVFRGCMIQHLGKAKEGYYVATAACAVGDLECVVTFDFGEDILERIYRFLPSPQVMQIRNALNRMPYQIEIDTKIRLHISAHLGELTRAPYEVFIPFMVTELLNVEYDLSSTSGPQDPEATKAQVPRLQE